MDTLF
jgi:RNA recognition motif-containing protein